MTGALRGFEAAGIGTRLGLWSRSGGPGESVIRANVLSTSAKVGLLGRLAVQKVLVE